MTDVAEVDDEVFGRLHDERYTLRDAFEIISKGFVAYYDVRTTIYSGRGVSCSFV